MIQPLTEEPLVPQVYNIQNCARCGGNHDVTFYPLSEPIGRWKSWGTCPNNNEPILQLAYDSEDPRWRATDLLDELELVLEDASLTTLDEIRERWLNIIGSAVQA